MGNDEARDQARRIITKHIRIGARVRDSWRVVRILGENAAGTAVRCEVLIDTAGAERKTD